MTNGYPDRPRSSGLFSGIVLITIGVLMLAWRYGHFNFGEFLRHWWPLIFIVWGVVKFYERTVAQRQGLTSGWITAGEIFLVVGVFCLVGGIIVVDLVKEKLEGKNIFEHIDVGDAFSYDLDMSPQTVPSNAHVQIQIPRGDITVRPSDEPQISIGGKKKVKSWNEQAAEKLAEPMKVEVAKDGDTYVVRPAGFSTADARFSFELEVGVPKKADVTVKTEKGNVHVSDLATGVAITAQKGDIEVSDVGGNVTIDTQGGDTTVSDIKGDVKIAGKGGEVSVTNATGGMTLNGEFYGPIRAEKVAKGVRFISHRSDFTLTQLTGHMEIGSGNFEVVDAPGNLALRTSSADVKIENPGGRVSVDNRNADIEVRYSNAPKDDIQLTNSSSGITLTLPGSSSFEITADCHSCDIDSDFSGGALNKTTTQSGDSHIEGKYGTGRPIKIILKTSYGSITIRKTS